MPKAPSLAIPAAVTVVLSVPLAILDRRMRATGGGGIIAFELAGPGRSEATLRKWGEDGRSAARGSLLLDFPYLAAYTTLNVRLTQRVGAALRARGATGAGKLAPVLAAIQIAAGACDAVENAALLGVIDRGGDTELAARARTAARLKFAALIIGWSYALCGLLARRVKALS